MWFNQDDQKKGSVSYERLLEIVDQIVYKIDPKLMSQAELLSAKNDLISSLEKTFIYNKQEVFDITTVIGSEDYKKFLNNLNFSNLVYAANIELLKFEGVAMQMAHEERKAQLLDRRRQLEDEKTHTAWLESADQLRADDMKQLEIAMMMDQKAHHEQMLKDLTARKDNLNQQIQVLSHEVVQSRKKTAVDIQDDLKNLDVDGEKVLAGLSHENLVKLSEGYVAIKEVEAKQLAALEKQIAIAQKKPINNFQQGHGGLPLHGFNQSSSSHDNLEVVRLKQKKVSVKQEAKSAFMKLTQVCEIDNDKAEKLHNSIESHSTIGQKVKVHADLAVKNDGLIREKRSELKNVEQLHAEISASISTSESDISNDAIELDKNNRDVFQVESPSDLIKDVHLHEDIDDFDFDFDEPIQPDTRSRPCLK